MTRLLARTLDALLSWLPDDLFDVYPNYPDDMEDTDA